MKTRSSETPKSTTPSATKKTPIKKESEENPKRSGSESTPKSVDTKSPPSSAPKTTTKRLVKKSTPKSEQPKVAETVLASTATQDTSGQKSVPSVKSSGKKVVRKVKSITPSKLDDSLKKESPNVEDDKKGDDTPPITEVQTVRDQNYDKKGDEFLTKEVSFLQTDKEKEDEPSTKEAPSASAKDDKIVDDDSSKNEGPNVQVDKKGDDTIVKESPTVLDGEKDEQKVVAAEAKGKGKEEVKTDSTIVEDAEEAQMIKPVGIVEENLAVGEDEFGEELEDYGEGERFEEPGDEECLQDDLSDAEEVEVTGQLEEEQLQISDHYKERKLKKAQEIFVGGLDRDANEDDVKKAFEKIGEVVEVRLHKNHQTNKNKGFAFVKFANKEQASRVLSELKNPVVRGKQCGVAPSEDNDTLFLGNICNTWTKEAIKRKLKEYGVDGIENITLVADTQHEGLSRGFAFIEFSCHADAMVAYKRLQKPDVIFGHSERTAKVAFAEPLREPDPEVMAQVKSVFVDGLPPYWDEDRVKERFKGYGEIERVVLARNMATAKRKDFGFVNFATHEAAIACIEGVNNTELGDAGKTRVKARARLANPLPKSQAVKGGMRGGFRIRHAGIHAGPGRGFGRSKRPLDRVHFERGRFSHPYGRGRAGRSYFADGNELERPNFRFGGKGPFRGRGGRGGSFGNAYQDEFIPRRGASSRFGLDRPRPGPLLDIDPIEPLHYDGPFSGRHFRDDSFMYEGPGRGRKRPFSSMDHEAAYVEPGSRLRPRYDFPDSISHRAHYRDSLGAVGGLYSQDYYTSDYHGGGYSSLYEDEHPIGRRYFY